MLCHATWHARQQRQVKPRLQEGSLWRSDVRIVFSVLPIISTELVNSAEATEHINTIVLTHHSLARREFVATAEGCLATQASCTCTFTIDRVKSKLNNARGRLTVPMSTDHFCRATP
jgi:hypothetical protein